MKSIWMRPAERFPTGRKSVQVPCYYVHVEKCCQRAIRVETVISFLLWVERCTVRTYMLHPKRLQCKHVIRLSICAFRHTFLLCSELALALLTNVQFVFTDRQHLIPLLLLRVCTRFGLIHLAFN